MSPIHCRKAIRPLLDLLVVAVLLVKTKLTRENKPLNPAQIQRELQALTAELLTLTTSKGGPKPQPEVRAQSNDSSKKLSRAS